MARLDAMPLMHDVARYGGAEVPLYKRAQITASHLSRATGGTGLGRFGDIDRLTAFADNLVPHTLRMAGALVYDDALAGRIERGELLAPGSPEEVEIRACGVPPSSCWRPAPASPRGARPPAVAAGPGSGRQGRAPPPDPLPVLLSGDQRVASGPWGHPHHRWSR